MQYAPWLTALALVAGCGGDDAGTVDAAGTHAADAGRPDANPSVKAFPLTSVEGGIAYTAEVTLGGSQTFNLSVDTGSTTLGVAATACASCQVSPKYTPGSGATDLHKTTSSQYGDGTSWSAEVFTDTVSLMGDSADVTIRLGSIQSSNGFFRQNDNSDQGILGFGDAALATPNTDSFIDKRKAAGLSTDFAFELCADSGKLWLDGVDPAATVSDLQYTPLVNNGYYSVNVTGATIAGMPLDASGAAVTDTGTSVMVVSSAFESKLIATVTGSAAYASMFSGQTLDENACITTSSSNAELDAALPPMIFTLPGKAGGSFTVSLPATRSYLLQQGDCFMLGVFVMDGLPLILGDTFLHSLVTDFDLPDAQIGFAPDAGCHEPARAPHVQRIGPVKHPDWYIRGQRLSERRAD